MDQLASMEKIERIKEQEKVWRVFFFFFSRDWWLVFFHFPSSKFTPCFCSSGQFRTALLLLFLLCRSMIAEDFILCCTLHYFFLFSIFYLVGFERRRISTSSGGVVVSTIFWFHARLLFAPMMKDRWKIVGKRPGQPNCTTVTARTRGKFLANETEFYRTCGRNGWVLEREISDKKSSPSSKSDLLESALMLRLTDRRKFKV